MGGDGGTGAIGGYAGTQQTGGMGGTTQTGGVGGGPPLGDIPCPSDDPNDPGECAVPADACCLTFANNESGSCVASNQASSCETDIRCNSEEDCPPNSVCCGRLVEWYGTWRYESVRCQASCDGDDSVVFCDPFDTTLSCDYGACGASAILPDGYYVCQ